MTHIFKIWIVEKLSLINKFFRSELSADMCWLYVIYFINYLVPLLLIPYLARVLGASGWGTLAFMLALASLMSLFIEYGFYVSAQREASRCQGDVDALSRLFNEVLSTKLLVSVFLVIVFSIAAIFFAAINQDLKLFFGVLFLGITQAFSFTWFFRGMQRIKMATVMELVSKLMGAILTFILIQTPLDFWKYFYAYGISHTIVLIWAFWCASKKIQLILPSFSIALKGLQNGGTFFALHIIGSIFTAGNVFLLGFLAPPQVVGYFAGIEKIIRFLANGIEPVRNAMFPRISNLIIKDYEEARAQVVQILVVSGGFSLVIGCLVFQFAPTIISIILGSDFLQAADILKLMSALIPILTFNAGLGFLWMLPRGFERVCVKVVLFALLLNIALALLLVPRWQHLGMAASVVISELFISMNLLVLFIRDKYKK